MPARTIANQIAFRYRSVDSATGVTRETAKRLAEYLGVDETQAIHRALHELAVRVLPQYEADDGPLTAAQVRQIRKRVPQGMKRSVRSSRVQHGEGMSCCPSWVGTAPWNLMASAISV